MKFLSILAMMPLLLGLLYMFWLMAKQDFKMFIKSMFQAMLMWGTVAMFVWGLGNIL